MRFFCFLSAFFFLLLQNSCAPGEKKVTIGYVQISEDPVLDEAKAGVFRALADSGYVIDDNIKVIENNAQGDLSMINTILQSFQSQNVDLIITNSTPCMAAAAQVIRSIPVVFTVSFGPEQIGMKSTPENLYGVFDPLKAPEYVDLMMACMPRLSRVGIPYNNAEPNAEYSFNIFKSEFLKRGIAVVAAPITGSNEILQAGQYLVDQNIDMMLVAADNTVYLGLPVLAKLASEKQIPLFASDPRQVEKGAAVGFGVNYDQWGYQSGIKAVELLNQHSYSIEQITPIVNYELVINQLASSKQGLAIPDEIKERAHLIINE
ncbi:MAG: ABC transporter substrate-binding protein [Lentimicrobiaceae bacterium]|nr:ABC transporter substrate-binding protein [Lentimicrobiaceae bacterium]MCB9024472.1 ABC transporter substrate-binding protein [Lentimicrobiaceae bacterium]MCO5265148.1 ABC transporter substrate-binding protein [Lentimicrobium sp.]